VPVGLIAISCLCALLILCRFDGRPVPLDLERSFMVTLWMSFTFVMFAALGFFPPPQWEAPLAPWVAWSSVGGIVLAWGLYLWDRRRLALV
jgi:hypothetical protein